MNQKSEIKNRISPPQGPEPLRSIHSTSFPQVLHQLGASVLVTTYQAGKLVMLRADGDYLNTHFRNFNKPMGLAVGGNRFALGTALEIWEFHNLAGVAPKLEPAGKHDACFLPRAAHVTGDIHIHEMAWAGGAEAAEEELWFVNTRFSCLCSRHPQYSFVPRWRPPFISALCPDDRCHLNGLAMRDGRPAYVTAHGAYDNPAGWRADKAHGGIVIDVASGATIARGLSMPHSPRWYDGKLWVLESGAGTIGIVDLQTGKYESVAALPGFTRGFDICGHLAFVGLSQVRETAVFSGIAIANRPLPERNCGVWVLDLRTGQIVAFVKFEDALQEIFAVQVLPGARFPDVVNDDPKWIGESFVLPDEALSAVPEPLRFRVQG